MTNPHGRPPMTRRQIEQFVRRQVIKAIIKPRKMTDDELKMIHSIVREIAVTWMQDRKIIEFMRDDDEYFTNTDD